MRDWELALSLFFLKNKTFLMNLNKLKISYPVSIPEAKDQLKETTDDNNNYITRLIKVATQEAETIVGMDLAYTKNTITIPDFIGGLVTINEGNFQSLVSITDASDVSVGYERVIEWPHKFKIELNDSIDTDLLTVVFYAGYTEDTQDVQNLESVKQYILIRIDDLNGPERSSYSFSTLRTNSNKAENLLNALKGFY